VALVRTDVSEGSIASIIRVKSINELGTALAVTNNRSKLRIFLLVNANVFPSSLILFTLMMEAIFSSETPVLTGTTRSHIPDDSILQDIFIVTVSNYNGPINMTKKGNQIAKFAVTPFRGIKPGGVIYNPTLFSA
jgi:hypothetical protein